MKRPQARTFPDQGSLFVALQWRSTDATRGIFQKGLAGHDCPPGDSIAVIFVTCSVKKKRKGKLSRRFPALATDGRIAVGPFSVKRRPKCLVLVAGGGSGNWSGRFCWHSLARGPVNRGGPRGRGLAPGHRMTFCPINLADTCHFTPWA